MGPCSAFRLAYSLLRKSDSAVKYTTTSQLMPTGHARCKNTSWSSVCPSWTSGSCCSPDAMLPRLMIFFNPSVVPALPWANKPVMCELPDNHTQTYKCIPEDQVGPKTQMAVHVSAVHYKKYRYDAVKKFCSIAHPVPSQLIVGRTLVKKRMLMSVATTIAIQLNCKLGDEFGVLKSHFWYHVMFCITQT